MNNPLCDNCKYIGYTTDDVSFDIPYCKKGNSKIFEEDKIDCSDFEFNDERFEIYENYK